MRSCSERVIVLAFGPRLFDSTSPQTYTVSCAGAVAQLEERINRTDEVRGSSPLSSITWIAFAHIRGQLLLLRILGRRVGAVAQLEEHLNGIQGVRGSNPLSSTAYLREHGMGPSSGTPLAP